MKRRAVASLKLSKIPILSSASPDHSALLKCYMLAGGWVGELESPGEQAKNLFYLPPCGPCDLQWVFLNLHQLFSLHKSKETPGDWFGLVCVCVGEESQHALLPLRSSLSCPQSSTELPLLPTYLFWRWFSGQLLLKQNFPVSKPSRTSHSLSEWLTQWQAQTYTDRLRDSSL